MKTPPTSDEFLSTPAAVIIEFGFLVVGSLHSWPIGTVIAAGRMASGFVGDRVWHARIVRGELDKRPKVTRAAGDPEPTLFRGECHYQDRRRVAVLPTAIKGEVRAFPEGLHSVMEGILVATAARPSDYSFWQLWGLP